MSTTWPPPGIAPVDYAAQITSVAQIDARIGEVKTALAEHANAEFKATATWEEMQNTFASSLPATCF